MSFLKFKRHIKKDDGYHLTSEWTSSQTVEMDNGNTLEEEIAELKNTITNIPSGDVSTVRYVNDESDPDFGQIQILLADGNWVKWQNAGNLSADGKLYWDGNNYGEFSAYAGSTSTYTESTNHFAPTITFGESMTVTMGSYNTATDGSGGIGTGSAISQAYDLTNYTKLSFNHSSTSTSTNSLVWIKVSIVATKSMNMTAVTSQTLLQNQASTSGDVTIDVSSLSGEHYIIVEVQRFSNIVPTTIITNMILE